MTRRFLAGLVAFSALGGVGWHHANAEALHNNFGLNPADVIFTITFDEDPTLNPSDVVTDQFMLYGVSFAPGDPGMKFNPVYVELPAGLGINGNHLGNFFTTDDIQNPFSIIFHTMFAGPTTAAAFGLWTNPNANTTFTALLNGAVVESFQWITSYNDPNDPDRYVPGATEFYGFFNSTGFDEIRIQIDSSANPPPDDLNLALLDNIQLTAPSDAIDPVPVPEPTTLLLFGVATLWGVRQRRRAGMLVN